MWRNIESVAEQDKTLNFLVLLVIRLEDRDLQVVYTGRIIRSYHKS